MGSKSLTRSRWAAIGAAVAVTLGGGGLIGVSAASGDASSLKTVDPVRILDTRSDIKVSGETKILKVTGEIPTVTLSGVVNATVVPAGATAVSMNLTVTEGLRNGGYGFVTAFPCAAATDTVPNASTLNFMDGVDIANSTVVPIDASGNICLNVYGIAHLIVDVNGYYTSSSAAGAFDATEYYTKDEIDKNYFQGGRTRNTQISAFDWQLGTSFCSGSLQACALSYPDGGNPYFTLENADPSLAAGQVQFYIPLRNESDGADNAGNNYDFYYATLCMADPSGTTFRAPELDSVTLYYDGYDSATGKYTRQSAALTISGGTGTAPGVTSDDDAVTCFGLLPPSDYEVASNSQNYALSVKMSDNTAVSNQNRLLLHGGGVLWYNSELYAENG